MAKKSYFDSVDPKVNFPELEEKILKFWKENKIFEKSVESRPENKTWTFLDGPPFVTGTPHYGTLLSSIPKDLFGRYWAMKGFRVRRVWGWDGHGLPIENKVETKLGIKRKKDIEDKVGVKKFIQECFGYVNEVSAEWEWYIDHIARWVDFKNAYKTWDAPYMESVMWVFRQMYDKDFIYKGLRVSLYCPHCSTPISNFEVAMDNDYKEIKEISNIYKYELEGEKGTYFLAWSTTPWNKIVTTALAVNPKLTYVKVEEGGEKLILAKSTLKMLKGKTHQILQEFEGKILVGKKYVPCYDFFKIEEGKKAFEVVGADFVSAEEGTGIVTIAPYGEEDLELMQKEGIHIELHVDDEGNLKDSVPNWGGMNYLEVDKLVNEDLQSRGLLYRTDEHLHTIPFCWRCHTRLFYNPQNAWFVDVQKLKPLMKKTNEKVNWFPGHFKHGRFLKSMEAAPDWCISRSRYWGSPVPVWECEACGERYVPGSIAELTEWSGRKITDLHKPEIDEVVIKCKKCGKNARRVPEVLDSWIEAGSASFAERHFPFDKTAKLKDFFPPDFIVEYTGQIRAWFYVLHVIAAALYGSHAFKNVVVTGVILGTDGRKMSKNFGNYPDPKKLLEKYGGDALRLYLLGSPVMHAEDIRISEEEYRNQIKDLMLILWNVYNFFATYANVDAWHPSEKVKSKSENVLDKWVLSRMYGSIKEITDAGYEKYDSPKIVEVAREFIVKDLSGWYVRRIRDRRKDAYSTLYFVLKEYLKVLAPLTPFLAETIYKNLTREESIHLADWPIVDPKLINLPLEREMEDIRAVAEKGHALRKEAKIPVRQALGSMSTTKKAPKISGLDSLLKDELNVLEIVWGTKKDELDLKVTPKLKAMGEAREVIRAIQDERKKMGTALDAWVDVYLEAWPKEFEEDIKAKARVRTLKRGEFKVK